MGLGELTPVSAKSKTVGDGLIKKVRDAVAKTRDAVAKKGAEIAVSDKPGWLRGLDKIAGTPHSLASRGLWKLGISPSQLMFPELQGKDLYDPKTITTASKYSPLTARMIKDIQAGNTGLMAQLAGAGDFFHRSAPRRFSELWKNDAAKALDTAIRSNHPVAADAWPFNLINKKTSRTFIKDTMEPGTAGGNLVGAGIGTALGPDPEDVFDFGLATGKYVGAGMRPYFNKLTKEQTANTLNIRNFLDKKVKRARPIMEAFAKNPDKFYKNTPGAYKLIMQADKILGREETRKIIKAGASKMKNVTNFEDLREVPTYVLYERITERKREKERPAPPDWERPPWAIERRGSYKDRWLKRGATLGLGTMAGLGLGAGAGAAHSGLQGALLGGALGSGVGYLGSRQVADAAFG